MGHSDSLRVHRNIGCDNMPHSHTPLDLRYYPDTPSINPDRPIGETKAHPCPICALAPSLPACPSLSNLLYIYDLEQGREAGAGRWGQMPTQMPWFCLSVYRGVIGVVSRGNRANRAGGMVLTNAAEWCILEG